MRDYSFGRLFFLDWAMRDQIRAAPSAVISVLDDDAHIMGYVPHEGNGTRIDLIAKPAPNR